MELALRSLEELEAELDYEFEFSLCYWCYREEVRLWKEWTRTRRLEPLLELLALLVRRLPRCLEEGGGGDGST